MWRKEQEYLALDELIWKIYSDTGYYNYVGLMPNGNLRQANLKMLFERAKKYETASFKGLYNFINFIEKLKINSGDLSSAKIIKHVELLGSTEKLTWKQKDDALVIEKPLKMPCDYAIAFRIVFAE